MNILYRAAVLYIMLSAFLIYSFVSERVSCVENKAENISLHAKDRYSQREEEY